MAKKSKIENTDPIAAAPKKSVRQKKSPTGAGPRASKKAAAKKVAAKKVAAKKRASSGLSLTLPLSRARKLAGDLYEAAGLAFWADAIQSVAEPKKSGLVQLQDSICDAADFLRDAKASNPRHLKLFWVACLDRSGLPSTTPRFVTAATEQEALAIWREAFKGEYGRRRPHAWPVPALAPAPGVHE